MIYTKIWALISFSAICVPAYHCSGGYVLTIPPPHTLPSYPRTQHPPCPLSQVTTTGGGLPPLSHRRAVTTPTTGARKRRLCLSSCSPLSFHTPPRPHTRPRTLTTPLHATTLHSHLPPANTPAPHSHLYFSYKLLVTARTPGLVPTVAKDRATLQIHSRLGKVYKKALVVPPSSPHQRAFVCGACTGTAQVGVSLVSLCDPLFKRSRLHCLDVCLT